MWDLLVTSQLALGLLEVHLRQTLSGPVFVAMWWMLDLSAISLIRRLASDCGASRQHTCTIEILFMLPLALFGAHFGTLLFINESVRAGTLIPALYSVMCLPVRGWLLLLRAAPLICQVALGRMSVTEVRQRLYQRSLGDRQGQCSELGRDRWVLAHARLRAQLWGTLLVSVLVAFDYFQPQAAWFFATPKSPAGLWLALRRIAVMSAFAKATLIGIDWFWSQVLWPSSAVAAAPRLDDPWEALPDMLREHSLSAWASAAAVLSLSVRWCLSLQTQDPENFFRS